MEENNNFKSEAKVKPEQKKSKNQPAWWQPAITMFLKLSVWIAGPIIIALYLGKWLDKKYNSEPWLFLLSIALAFFISMIGLVKNTIREFKKIEEQAKKGKKN